MSLEIIVFLSQNNSCWEI